MESQQLQSKVPASEVANEFVRQYYCCLNHFPNDLYMFYKECSTITRPETNGRTVNIKTLEGIRDKIAPRENEAQISSVDCQEAPNECYMILVTGVMLGRNNVERKFAQTFFLAPQERGTFILSDLFRYLEEPQYSEQKSMLVDGVSDKPLHDYKTDASSISDAQTFPATELVPEAAFQSQHYKEEATKTELQESQGFKSQPSKVEDVKTSTESVQSVAELVPEHKLHGLQSEPSELVEEQAAEAVENEKQLKTVEKTISPPEERTKRSFLSVLVKENVHPIKRQTTVVKFPINTRPEGDAPSQVQPTSRSLDFNPTAKASNRSREASVNENSIHIRNLPWNITTCLLEKEFEKFGYIKPNGIQIKTNKEQSFCFGFIEFQSSTSVEGAIKASPIIISGRRVYVEKKRPSGIKALTDHRVSSYKETIPNNLKQECVSPRKKYIPNNLKRGGGIGNGQNGYARSLPKDF